MGALKLEEIRADLSKTIPVLQSVLSYDVTKAKQGLSEVYKSITAFVTTTRLKLHYSLLEGENYSFNEHAEIEEQFGPIAENLSNLRDALKSACNILAKIAVPNDESYLATLAEVRTYLAYVDNLSTIVDLHRDLTEQTYNEIVDFGKEKRGYHQFYVSRVINFSKFQNSLISGKPSPPTDNDFLVLQINLLVAEADFHLKTSNDYTTGLIEIYKTLDFLRDSARESVNKKSIELIIWGKCLFLLKKAFSRRADLRPSFTFMSLQSNRIKTVDIDAEFKKLSEYGTFYETFVQLSTGRYGKHFNPSDDEYKNQLLKHQDALAQHTVDFSAVHYLLKYYRDHFDDQSNNLTDTKIGRIDKLTKEVSRVIDTLGDHSKFDEFAYTSLRLSMAKAKLRVLISDYSKPNGKEIIARTPLVEIKNRVSLSEEFFEDVEKIQRRMSVPIKDFLHLKLLLNAKIALASKYILDLKGSELYKLEKPDRIKLDEIKTSLKHLSDLSDGCIDLIPRYQEYLSWALKHNYQPLYLPYDQCFCPHEEAKGLFIDTAYILPVNYESELEQFNLSRIKSEEIVERLLILDKDYHDKQFMAIEKEILASAAESLKTSTDKSEDKMMKEISNNGIRSVQFLGIFSGVISLAVLTFGGIKDLKEPDLFLIAVLAIAATLSIFSGFIGIMSLSFEKREDITKLKAMGWGAGILVALFLITYIYYRCAPESSFNRLESKVDSSFILMQKYDSVWNSSKRHSEDSTHAFPTNAQKAVVDPKEQHGKPKSSK